ncbi:hypothetical protein JTB14_001006 [Gonioctena quinquepunctata]|nr:hypothetical protein JTB14_001006 [Gonioctena quinquepunctata]
MGDSSGLNITIGNQSNSEDVFEEVLESTDLVTKIYIELYTILTFVCIACNIILGFVIIKYRRLRREKSNIILLNWTIVNNLFMLSSPISARLSMDWETYFDGIHIFCTLEQVQLSILLTNLLLIIVLFIDWFLKLYYTVTHQKFEKNLIFILGALYVCTAVCIGFTVEDCFSIGGIRADIYLLFSYVIFIVFMIIMNIVHFVKKRRLINTTNVSHTPLYLANTYFLSVCPLFILVFIILGLSRYGINEVIALTLICGTLVLALMNPIYFFVILFKYEKDYRTFLGHIFSCKCFDYKDDELQEEPVVFNGSVQI